MRSAQVVIGSNYGDEGKGLITDWLVSANDRETAVVRISSSAQAGHTVVTPDGRRHVFHHVGSGAFLGAATVLSRFFVSHPMLLLPELETLAALGVRPEIFADPRGIVATPFDVMINQLAERERGAGRHGSCGIGFNEAVERSLRPRFAITCDDLSRPAELRARLYAIRDAWVPGRLATLGLAPLDGEEGERLRSDDLVERWLEDVAAFRDTVRPLAPGERPAARSLVFEGAQGLLLDEEAAGFPHVTRSRTGIRNAVTLAQEMELDRLDAIYVTRAYVTRHGAGPLPDELDAPPFSGIADPTNQPNPYQGRLRFAYLDPLALGRRIAADLDFRAAGVTAHASLAITCLDQLDERAVYSERGRPYAITRDDLPAMVSSAAGLEVRCLAKGPTRDDVSSLPPRHAASRRLSRPAARSAGRIATPCQAMALAGAFTVA